jgi:RNA polymerase sigma factor (sigma-70 family)
LVTIPNTHFRFAGKIEDTVNIPPPDPGALEQWFFEFRGSVFGYLRSLGCPHPMADEITQEAFLRLQRTLQDGKKIADVRAWLFRVARNLWIDDRRERRRFETGPDLIASDSSPDPEQQILERERIQLVEEQLRRLPELQRECMRLKALGLRYHEIASTLDIPMAAAVDHVRRAVQRLGRRYNSPGRGRRTRVVDTADVTVPVNDGAIPAYRARPRARGPHATIIVVHETYGLDEHIKNVCRGLAQAGYDAVAPSLCWRAGDFAPVPDEQLVSDLDATAEYAAATGCDPDRLGMVGFSWGGRAVWLYAARRARLKAGVVWHGTSDPRGAHPPEPAADLKCPVLALYYSGDNDAAAWRRMLDWFQAHGLAA